MEDDTSASSTDDYEMSHCDAFLVHTYIIGDLFFIGYIFDTQCAYMLSLGCKA